MTDTDDTDNADRTRTVPENADATQPPEQLDDGGTCLACGDSFPTLEQLAEHAETCSGPD